MVVHNFDLCISIQTAIVLVSGLANVFRRTHTALSVMIGCQIRFAHLDVSKFWCSAVPPRREQHARARSLVKLKHDIAEYRVEAISVLRSTAVIFVILV